ncbi:MAG: hypothetical protein IJR06_02420, partial [Paludibacteraceae bacterium]|nr:hypothetical protein [Paludibacteraceae bacterium]
TYSGNFGASGAQKPSLLGLCQHAAQKALAKGPIGSQTRMGRTNYSANESRSKTCFDYAECSE